MKEEVINRLKSFIESEARSCSMEFMEKNHRNPSRHRLEEHDMLNWVKQQRKLKNKGDLKAERAEMFKELLALGEGYKRKNQYE